MARTYKVTVILTQEQYRQLMTAVRLRKRVEPKARKTDCVREALAQWSEPILRRHYGIKIG